MFPVLALLACDPGVPDVPADAPATVFEVPKGATARGLGPALADAGVVRSARRWTWFLRLGADAGCIKAGRHEVRPGMDGAAILAALCAAPIPDEVSFTVVEGWRIRDIDAALVDAGLAPAGAYTDATRAAGGYQAAFPLPSGTLEGYLYPETYRLPAKDLDLHVLVQKQLDTFAARFWTAEGATLGGRSLHEVVTMASLLEREEPSPANRPLVAGILWKRIANDWNLGVDATSRYTLADWNDRGAFMKKLRDPADPWNTRLRPGLPPTPIGNPALDSLKAAKAPVDSPYWYYLHDATKTLHPSRNKAEHEAFRKRFDVY
ncbi:MAG: endolytic transglycosylase MltG [Pseudomonadota bacterium]|jgi:UPF0755 protein